MPVWVQWISFSLAIVGSISGIYALYLNYQRTVIVKRKENERLESKKKAKFKIERVLERDGKGSHSVLYLQNFGESGAKNVKVKFYKGNDQEVFPLYSPLPTTINAGQKARAVLGLHKSVNVPFEVLITWDDDYKVENELKETLS